MVSLTLKQDVVTKTLREWISSGRYSPGEKLPTNEELAEYFDVNRRTIASGIRPLVDEGLLDKAPRRGTTVLSRPSRPVSNAVGLIAPSRGDIYANLVRDIDFMLHGHDLFPVVVDNDLAYDPANVEQFLSRMLRKQQPTGFIMEGSTAIPYEYIAANPACFANTVFIIYYHWMKQIPGCRSVLIDFEGLGRMAAEYFAEKGAKHILFPAVCEKFVYKGEWTSMQVRIMKSLSKRAKELGILFDESEFWSFFNNLGQEELLRGAFLGKNPPDALFTWSDARLVDLMPVLSGIGIGYDDLKLLATHNTPYAERYGIDSMDFRIREILDTAVGMLTGEIDREKVLLLPNLAVHTKNAVQKNKQEN